MPPVRKSSQISKLVLRWYDAHARELPWRVPPAATKQGQKPDPYRVWLSEIMLQQTTVATVKERYTRFLSLWPSVQHLAAASQSEVLAEWAGLGYYARARNLHKCAHLVATSFNGCFPEDAKMLQSLPGIGPYTAAAIASIAFEEAAPVMDGNIERVMARLFAVETPLPAAKPTLYEHAAALTPPQRPGDYAQALMDIGATICTPRNPDCALCPVQEFCAAKKQGVAADLPRKAAKKAKPTRQGVAFVLRRASDGACLLRQRPQKGLLGGMLALPSTEWTEKPSTQKRIMMSAPAPGKWDKSAAPVRHTFTHFHLILDIWHMTVPPAKAAKCEGEWHVAPEEAGLPTVFRKVLDKISS